MAAANYRRCMDRILNDIQNEMANAPHRQDNLTVQKNRVEDS